MLERLLVGDSPRSTPTVSAGLSSASLNQGYYQSFFKEERRLGRGYRGSVYLCRHVLDGILLGSYAVKKIPVGDNHPWLERMLKEVRALEELHHPNIIGYKHAWLEVHQATKFGPEVPCLFVLMDYANGGNLSSVVTSISNDSDTAAEGPSSSQRSPSLLEESSIWHLLQDICLGLKHLHDRKIIHCDLKPENLLLHYPNESDRVVATYDFSLLCLHRILLI